MPRFFNASQTRAPESRERFFTVHDDSQYYDEIMEQGFYVPLPIGSEVDVYFTRHKFFNLGYPEKAVMVKLPSGYWWIDDEDIDDDPVYLHDVEVYWQLNRGWIHNLRCPVSPLT